MSVTAPPRASPTLPAAPDPKRTAPTFNARAYPWGGSASCVWQQRSPQQPTNMYEQRADRRKLRRTDAGNTRATAAVASANFQGAHGPGPGRGAECPRPACRMAGRFLYARAPNVWPTWTAHYAGAYRQVGWFFVADSSAVNFSRPQRLPLPRFSGLELMEKRKILTWGARHRRCLLRGRLCFVCRCLSVAS
jgi:hypothetical protein